MQRLILFILSGIATILGLPAPTDWFGNTAALAGIVIAVVAGLRKALPAVEGVMGTVLAVIVGGVLGALGWAGGLAADASGLWQAVMFGVGAGWIASGGWDALSALLGKLRAAPSEN